MGVWLARLVGLDGLAVARETWLLMPGGMDFATSVSSVDWLIEWLCCGALEEHRDDGRKAHDGRDRQFEGYPCR